ncbi:unnamed protein product [Peronospora belbahrii]|uniref:Uncharacterized protein n=1 Tax=Peronospora belbahrii TaxID=622444 RepID=A0AAU9L2J6_9STRA|nr:unnamed protein product [Peronospora belbahrii]CAH0521440.1 unnamed protein product [Peronospora belbahrii]
MVQLQCLLSTSENVRVVTVEMSLNERIGVLQDRLREKLDMMDYRAKPDMTMKLYQVQQHRLTYRHDPTTKQEVLFFDGVEASASDASRTAILQNATQLVPWTIVSWCLQDQQFIFPDAVDIVVVWENDEKLA